METEIIPQCSIKDTENPQIIAYFKLAALYAPVVEITHLIAQGKYNDAFKIMWQKFHENPAEEFYGNIPTEKNRKIVFDALVLAITQLVRGGEI